MASTNKTPYYELSQYQPEDRPTYLGDYNSDMSKIDTAMREISVVSDNASNSVATLRDTVNNILDNQPAVQDSLNHLEADITALNNNYVNLSSILTDLRDNVSNINSNLGKCTTIERKVYLKTTNKLSLRESGTANTIFERIVYLGKTELHSFSGYIKVGVRERISIIEALNNIAVNIPEWTTYITNVVLPGRITDASGGWFSEVFVGLLSSGDNNTAVFHPYVPVKTDIQNFNANTELQINFTINAIKDSY